MLSTIDMAESKNLSGHLLERLSWQEAEALLTPSTVVVIPLGAQCKEHGPHLRLDNDFVMANYFRDWIMERMEVVVAPTINYSFYPAMVEYPGSVSLSLDTACNTTVEICQSLSRFGPTKYYVLNTGISTIRPLSAAKKRLQPKGIHLEYTDLRRLESDKIRQLQEQEGGTHADEIETSMMLYIAPESVDMSLAKRDFSGSGPGPLSRTPGPDVIHSPTGTWGDPTLASVEKGKVIVEEICNGIERDIMRLID